MLNLLNTGSGSTSNPTTLIIMMVAMFAIMYFVMIRPQKKRQKEEQEMRNAVALGDEITTIGGITGRVVAVKEDFLVIETGSAGSKLQMTRWSIQTNNTATERLKAEREQARLAAEKEREEKKAKKKSKKEEK